MNQAHSINNSDTLGLDNYYNENYCKCNIIDVFLQ